MMLTMQLAEARPQALLAFGDGQANSQEATTMMAILAFSLCFPGDDGSRGSRSDGMPSEMLDRLQEDKLHGLEALIDAYESATAVGHGQEEAAAIADFFVDEGIGVRQS